MIDRICLYNIYGLNEYLFHVQGAVCLSILWRSWACDGRL